MRLPLPMKEKRDRAEQSEQQAKQSELHTQQIHYAADIGLAQHEWERTRLARSRAKAASTEGRRSSSGEPPPPTELSTLASAMRSRTP